MEKVGDLFSTFRDAVIGKVGINTVIHYSIHSGLLCAVAGIFCN